MPAKKKQSAKSVAVSEKERHLQHEVDVMHQLQGRERLRNDEAVLRERVEQEEKKMLESHLIRSMEVRCAVIESERQAYYTTREHLLKEAIDTLEQRTQQTAAQLQQMQRSLQQSVNEKETLTRRVDLLKNELELAQARFLEVQVRADDKEHVADAEREALQNALNDARVALEMERAEKQQSPHHAEDRQASSERGSSPSDGVRAQTDDAATGAPGCAQSTESCVELGQEHGIDARTVEAETAVLMQVLHSDVEHFKTLAVQRQADLERKERDEAKSSLLIAILNTQLDGVREENRRLHQVAQTRHTELQAVQSELTDAKTGKRQMSEELARACAEAAVEQRKLCVEMSVHKGQVEELTTRLHALTAAYERAQEEHRVAVEHATTREQADFRVHVAMKGDLEKVQGELAQLQQEKGTMLSEAQSYKVCTRAEVDSLKARIMKLQEALSRKEREAYETIGVLQSDVLRLTTEAECAARVHQEEMARMRLDLDTVHEERQQLQRVNRERQEAAESDVREMYSKLVHMTACHDTAHEQLLCTREKLRQKEEEYANTVILLSAEKQNLQTKLHEREERGVQLEQESSDRIVNVSEKLATLQERMVRETERHTQEMQAASERAERAEQALAEREACLEKLSAALRRDALIYEDKEKALKSDARELRRELSMAKRTILHLEAAMGDEVNFGQLKELNAKLMKECELYTTRVAELEAKLQASVTEQEVMGGYALRKVQEENSGLQRQLRLMERMHQHAVPTLHALRVYVEQSAVPEHVQTLLANYDAQKSHFALYARPQRHEPALTDTPAPLGTDSAVRNNTAAAVAKATPSSSATVKTTLTAADAVPASESPRSLYGGTSKAAAVRMPSHKGVQERAEAGSATTAAAEMTATLPAMVCRRHFPMAVSHTSAVHVSKESAHAEGGPVSSTQTDLLPKAAVRLAAPLHSGHAKAVVELPMFSRRDVYTINYNRTQTTI